MNRNQRRLQAKAAPQAAVVQAFNVAVGHHRAGRLGEAEAIYRRILDVDASHSESLNLLGLIAHQSGRHAVAVDLIGKAIAIKKNAASYHSNLGLALRDLGRAEDALAAYDAALRVQPDYVEAHTNRGVLLKRLGRLDDALAAYDAAVRSRPDFALAHLNRGLLLRDLHRPQWALEAFDAVLRLNPGHAEAALNRGVALKELGRHEEALAACDEAVRLNPGLAEAHLNRGNALMGFGRHADALTAYDEALRLDPAFAIAHADRGQALSETGRLHEALAAYDESLRLAPDYADAHLNRGVVLKDLGRLDAARAAYDDALRIRPDYAEVYSNRLLLLHYSEIAAEGEILATARRFGERFDRAVVPPAFASAPGRTRRLRIGYLSGDLRRHPVGYFIESTLAHHDRTAIEVFCYDTSGRADDLTERLRASVDRWTCLSGLNDEDAAARIRADAVDVLIDLSGHTALNRLTMLAHRPAPVQVSWLGYFGTTGLAAMDYVLADRYVAPKDADHAFVERVWRLPDSYLCFTPPDLDVAVEDAPARPLTFGSFNNHSKTSPRTVALWAEVLNRVPDSRLLLKTKSLGDSAARADLVARFAAHGVGADRLLLEGGVPRAALLASYNRVDIALDPTPYGGGTTTAEALWMGVPVVSLRGGTWVGRVSESILATVGLGDLVADDAAGYAAIAAALAQDAARRATLRHNLRTMLVTSPLCDGAGFTRRLEAALLGMWHERREAAAKL